MRTVRSEKQDHEVSNYASFNTAVSIFKTRGYIISLFRDIATSNVPVDTKRLAVDEQKFSSVKVQTELGTVKSFHGEVLKRLFNFSTPNYVQLVLLCKFIASIKRPLQNKTRN